MTQPRSPVDGEAVRLWRFAETYSTGLVRHHHYEQPTIYSNGAELTGAEGVWRPAKADAEREEERQEARSLIEELRLNVDSPSRGNPHLDAMWRSKMLARIDAFLKQGATT